MKSIRCAVSNSCRSKLQDPQLIAKLNISVLKLNLSPLSFTHSLLPPPPPPPPPPFSPSSNFSITHLMGMPSLPNLNGTTQLIYVDMDPHLRPTHRLWQLLWQQHVCILPIGLLLWRCCYAQHLDMNIRIPIIMWIKIYPYHDLASWIQIHKSV